MTDWLNTDTTMFSWSCPSKELLDVIFRWKFQLNIYFSLQSWPPQCKASLPLGPEWSLGLHPGRRSKESLISFTMATMHMDPTYCPR